MQISIHQLHDHIQLIVSLFHHKVFKANNVLMPANLRLGHNFSTYRMGFKSHYRMSVSLCAIVH